MLFLIRKDREEILVAIETKINDPKKLRRLQLEGHIQRIDGKRMPKKSAKQQYWTRPMGKPTNEWVKTVELDGREIVKI
jgi:hypothetical protein